MRDLVIGTAVGYGWKEIEVWAKSLCNSGFTGQKLLLACDITDEAQQELLKRNFYIHNVKVSKEEFSPVVDRFIYYWRMLRDFPDTRYVIATDVRDVIFQTNPSDWLDGVSYNKIVASSEGVLYKNEPWGKNNLAQSFGSVIYETMQDNICINAGVQVGLYEVMIDLFLNIFLLCDGKPKKIPGGGGPDQAALNVLLSLEPYKSMTQISSYFSAQLGTTGPQINLLLVDKNNKPLLDNGMVCKYNRDAYPIVHQYDRVKEWNEILEKKYREMP